MVAVLRLSLLVLFTFFSFSLSAVSLTQTVPLHFGSVSGQAGYSCVLDSRGTISGDCNATDTNILMGQITVTDILRNSQVEVIINGSSNASLTFVPTAEVSGGKGGRAVITDGQSVIIDTKGGGNELVIDIYGVLTIQSDLGAGATYTADYTVHVNQL
ncbi:hypothetical protein [Alteromonas sp. CYL-A6]|uniref:hypothetical protein n=1 Tax=Alteromonas nitratireducens TaxID=3390813 RepID=UPI0034B7BE0A